MSFDFTCPFCSQVMQCEDEWRGRQAKCPTCGKNITLNPPSPVPSPIPMSNSTPKGNFDNPPKKKTSLLTWIITLIVGIVAIGSFLRGALAAMMAK